MARIIWNKNIKLGKVNLTFSSCNPFPPRHGGRRQQRLIVVLPVFSTWGKNGRDLFVQNTSLCLSKLRDSAPLTRINANRVIKSSALVHISLSYAAVSRWVRWRKGMRIIYLIFNLTVCGVSIFYPNPQTNAKCETKKITKVCPFNLYFFLWMYVKRTPLALLSLLLKNIS